MPDSSKWLGAVSELKNAIGHLQSTVDELTNTGPYHQEVARENLRQVRMTVDRCERQIDRAQKERHKVLNLERSRR